MADEAKKTEAGAEGRAYQELYDIVVRLRAPDGCPWDREQTPRSMRGGLVEEAYELVEAIDEGDPAHAMEEAGDLFLNTTMITYMFEQEGRASVKESLRSICEKLVRRHPHVFGDSKADTSEKVLEQWAEIKEKVEGRRPKDSLLDEVSRAMPTLERAYKLQRKAAKVGFDWKDKEAVWAKAREELAEAEEACGEILAARGTAGGTVGGEVGGEAGGEAGDTAGSEALAKAESHLEEELGDLLFSVVNLARSHHVDPSLALARANEKFLARFRHVEKRMKETGQVMKAGNLAIMDGFWDEAKRL
jgi:tetrapyrrole methylase family protein/MazG family protein